ncbi:unnamed protein product [Protopolystoma xenopodis]|uniref:Uncharacterized protein n=1 Tax=Protopolystoma xenopodis TaxID=117903 RepID=A0A3S5AYN9_9PLAT|nr:unnamed protein product [Protopolystoma xenopodis]
MKDALSVECQSGLTERTNGIETRNRKWQFSRVFSHQLTRLAHSSRMSHASPHRSTQLPCANQKLTLTPHQKCSRKNSTNQKPTLTSRRVANIDCTTSLPLSS